MAHGADDGTFSGRSVRRLTRRDALKLAGTWIKQNVRLNPDDTGTGGEPKGRACRVATRRSSEPRDESTVSS